METVLLIAVVAWLSASFIVAVVVGRGIRLADQRSVNGPRVLTTAALTRSR